MAIPKRTILVFFIVIVSCFSGPAASAENTARDLRIGLIGADPAQLMQDFEPFLKYLKASLRPSGIRDVTVFVARDLNRLRSRIQTGKLDFILTSAFPVIQIETACRGFDPAVVAVQGAARGDSAVFFVRKQSAVHDLADLRGKTIVFGTPWSTTGYAMAAAELKEHNLVLRRSTDEHPPLDAVRYTFAGEPVNQVFRVIRHRADAGVFGGSDWEALPPKEQSRLRIIHRTAPLTSLFGSFRPLFPAELRNAVERALVDMSGNGKGRTALAAALHMTAFERLTDEDRNALEHFRQQLAAADKP